MRNQSEGFTLIEVLVALAILATVLTASYTLEAQSVKHLKHVRQQIIAHWVGDNLVSHIKLGILFIKTPGIVKGTTQLLQQTIPWRIESSVLPTTKQKAYTLYLSTKENSIPLQTIRFYESIH